MSAEVSVALDALATYAKAANEISDRFDSIRRTLAEADVEGGSFGLLGESNDLHEVYAEQCDTALRALNDGRDVFAEIADIVTEMRTTYELVERGATEQFGGGR